MDQERQAVVHALSASLAGTSSKLEKQLLACLQSAKCQKTTAMCVGKKGPCDERVARSAARRSCRPLKQELLAAARANVCEPYVERLRPNLMAQHGGDEAAVRARMEGLVSDCAAAHIDRDPQYWACVNGALREDLVACALLNCRASAAACAAKQCFLESES